ncbi:hypothetical protein ACE4Z7_24860, partial [Salmonella enterica]|uniref:hypothetical protein n=1 Tax=Salmonella enterica TaxID=28901 RepID=UPI003D2658C8
GGDIHNLNKVAKVYRTASMLDCLLGYNTWSTVEQMRHDLQDDISNENISPSQKIIGIELQIDQKVSYKTTEPLDGFQEEHGPRFASI